MDGLRKVVLEPGQKGLSYEARDEKTLWLMAYGI